MGEIHLLRPRRGCDLIVAPAFTLEGMLMKPHVMGFVIDGTKPGTFGACPTEAVCVPGRSASSARTTMDWLCYSSADRAAPRRWEIEPTLTRLDTVSESPLSEISARVIRAVHISGCDVTVVVE